MLQNKSFKCKRYLFSGLAGSSFLSFLLFCVLVSRVYRVSSRSLSPWTSSSFQFMYVHTLHYSAHLFHSNSCGLDVCVFPFFSLVIFFLKKENQSFDKNPWNIYTQPCFVCVRWTRSWTLPPPPPRHLVGLPGVRVSWQAGAAVLKGKSGRESKKRWSYSVVMSLESSSSRENQNSSSISAGKFWDVHVCVDERACTRGAPSGVAQAPSRGSLSAATKMLTGPFHVLFFLPGALSRQFMASIILANLAYLMRWLHSHAFRCLISGSDWKIIASTFGFFVFVSSQRFTGINHTLLGLWVELVFRGEIGIDDTSLWYSKMKKLDKQRYDSLSFSFCSCCFHRGRKGADEEVHEPLVPAG